jgi:hypothetical protein
MSKNPILDELHAVRQQLLADAGGTLDALVDQLQAEEQQSKRAQFQPRRTIRSAGAATSSEMAAENPLSPPGER